MPHDHHAPGVDARPWLRVLVLLGLGLYFVYNLVTGNLTNYVNVRFAWLSYVGAAIFLLLGATGAWSLLRARAHDHHDHDHDYHHDHSHGVVSWSMLAVTAIPLLLGTLIPSRPLGADAVNGSLSMNAAPATTATTATTLNIPPEKRNVLDWLRAFNTAPDYTELNGLPADVIGFIYREPSFGADQFMVARFTISCCVADASAIGLPVVWARSADLQADTWVRVRGKFQVSDFRGDSVPVLHAVSVETIPQPEHPYLYP